MERLQRDLESLFPTIAIDGLYGSQSVGFVEEIQTSNGLTVTGLVSEELAAQIAEAESADSVGSGGDATDGSTSSDVPDEADGAETDEAATDEATTGESASGPATEASCTELIGQADDPDFTAERIEECSALGVDLVGEG